MVLLPLKKKINYLLTSGCFWEIGTSSRANKRHSKDGMVATHWNSRRSHTAHSRWRRRYGCRWDWFRQNWGLASIVGARHTSSVSWSYWLPSYALCTQCFRYWKCMYTPCSRQFRPLHCLLFNLLMRPDVEKHKRHIALPVAHYDFASFSELPQLRVKRKWVLMIEMPFSPCQMTDCCVRPGIRINGQVVNCYLLLLFKWM